MVCALAGLHHFPAEDVFTGPWALHHFMPAGTLIQALTTASPDRCCKHDGWHSLRGHFDTTLAGLDPSLIRSIGFLVKYEFIAVTARIATIHNIAVIILRVYIIPFDLSGVEGRLQRRNQARVLQPGRRHTRTLLRTISKDRDAWDGRPTLGTAHLTPLLGSDVSRS